MNDSHMSSHSKECYSRCDNLKDVTCTCTSRDAYEERCIQLKITYNKVKVSEIEDCETDELKAPCYDEALHAAGLRFYDRGNGVTEIC